MSELKTLLVISPGRDKDESAFFNLYVAETGEFLGSHYCFDSSYAYYDLYTNRKEEREEWEKRFGDIDVKFISDIDMTEEEFLKKIEECYKEVTKDTRRRTHHLLKGNKMGKYINLLITLSDGYNLIRCGLKLNEDSIDSDVIEYYHEPESREVIYDLLPEHIQSFGDIVDIEYLFDIHIHEKE